MQCASMLLFPRLMTYTGRHSIAETTAVVLGGRQSGHRHRGTSIRLLRKHRLHERRRRLTNLSLTSLSTSSLSAHDRPTTDQSSEAVNEGVSAFRDRALSVNSHYSNQPIDAPFFPVYYNDVYEVELPRGHRFPMGKYRKVRKALQAKVERLSEEERRRVYCGKLMGVVLEAGIPEIVSEVIIL